MNLIPDEKVEWYERKNFVEKPIQRIHWYDILANPDYVDDFCYVSPSIANRNLFIKDDDSDDENNFEQSDMVKVLLNLGYLRSDLTKSL